MLQGVSQPNLNEGIDYAWVSQEITNENRCTILTLARRADRSAADVVGWFGFRDERDRRGSVADSAAAFSRRQLVESRHQRMAGGSELGELYQLHQ